MRMSAFNSSLAPFLAWPLFLRCGVELCVWQTQNQWASMVFTVQGLRGLALQRLGVFGCPKPAPYLGSCAKIFYPLASCG